MTASVSVPGEVRKLVTVLFSDVSGSTAIGHELDPESLRRLMSRYFGRMQSVLERHGGTVEKFIGDAVVAMFGIPLSHEDDALRAVRAAVEMRAALDDLNEEFRRAWGVTLETRTGVNTGEVIAGDLGHGHSFAVGTPSISPPAWNRPLGQGRSSSGSRPTGSSPMPSWRSGSSRSRSRESQARSSHED